MVALAELLVAAGVAGVALLPALAAVGCGAALVLAGVLAVVGAVVVVLLLCCGAVGVLAAESIVDVGLAVLHAAASASRHSPLGKL